MLFKILKNINTSNNRMQLNFDDISFKTVKSNYSWDLQNPNEALVENAFNDTFDVIGYAPYLNVEVKTSVQDLDKFTIFAQRSIDFGDEYNAETNTATVLTTSDYIFNHNYIMPGEYTITLSQTQYIQVNTSLCSGGANRDPHLYTEYDLPPTKRYPRSWMWYCFMQNEATRPPETTIYGSLHSGFTCLTWDDLKFQEPSQVTWDEAQGPSYITRAKDVSWQWKYVVCDPSDKVFNYHQKVKWSFTKEGNIIPKTWKNLQNLGCGIGTPCMEMVPRLSAYTVTKTYSQKIKVLEIPPNAYLTVINVVTGVEFTALLSPQFTRCGSFPIEKIIWDLGDGSPIIEQSRNFINTDSRFVFNNRFENDRLDPRNYDVICTYTRNFADGSCFYPSITAVASSTFTTDRAAAIVGPVSLDTVSNEVALLQNELTDKGKVYMGQIKDEIVFWKNDDITSFVVPVSTTKTTPNSYIQLINKNKFVTDISNNEKLTLID